MTYLWLVASSLAKVQAAAWLAQGVRGSLSGAAVLVVWCCLEGYMGWFPAGQVQLGVCVGLSSWWPRGRLELGALLLWCWGLSWLRPVFYQQSHHHSSFLVHLQVEADLSLPAHLKAEPSASEKLVSPA